MSRIGIAVIVCLGLIGTLTTVGCGRPVPKWNPAVLEAAKRVHRNDTKEKVDDELPFNSAYISNLSNSAMLDVKPDEPTVGYQYEILPGNVLLVVFKKKEMTVLYTYPDPNHLKDQP